MLASEVIKDLSKAEPLAGEWDQLAVANQLSLMSPQCVMAWWRHLAPAGAQPRIIAVTDEGRLVGLAPFYLDPAARGRVGLRLPCIELGGRLAPLAHAGYKEQVARALADALVAGACPDLIALEAAPLADDWASVLRETWPGRVRPTTRHYQSVGSPTVSLHGDSFDAWLQAKSSSFRSEMRRLRRRFAAEGGTLRASTLNTLEPDVEVFVRLHGSRWENRGGSKLIALGAGLPGFVADIGRSLLHEDERFLLLMFEVDGEPISAQLFLPAGGRVHYIAAGWDERFARMKPTILGMLAAIEFAYEHGHERVDLGPGEQHYKLRFADGSDPVTWTLLVPASVRLPLTLAQTIPLRTRATVQNTLKRRLSDKQISRLRQGLQRLGAG